MECYEPKLNLIINPKGRGHMFYKVTQATKQLYFGTFHKEQHWFEALLFQSIFWGTN